MLDSFGLTNQQNRAAIPSRDDVACGINTLFALSLSAEQGTQQGLVPRWVSACGVSVFATCNKQFKTATYIGRFFRNAPSKRALTCARRVPIIRAVS